MSERDRQELLREAACLGDVELVTKLVNEGVDVNSANDLNGWTGLHWACKRGRASVVAFLLEAGADTEALTAKGEKPQQLTSNADILSLLRVEENGHRERSPAAEGDLPIVPNYLQSPALGYVSDAGRRRAEAQMRRDAAQGPASSPASSASSNNNENDDESTALTAGATSPPARAVGAAADVTNGAPHGMAAPFHPVFFPTAYPLINHEELVVKVRLQPGCTAAAPADVDFVEVELSRRGLTMASLVRVCSLELGVEPGKVTRVRKLPNTRLRKDKDLTRLADFQELELVLGGGVGGELGELSVVGSQDSLADKPCFNARASKLTY